MSAERSQRSRRGTEEGGSVLLLFPAALLVVLVLGSLCVDTAIVHLRQRELVGAAMAAANDAATEAVDIAHLRRTGELRLDGARAEAAVWRSLARQGVLPLLAAPPRARVTATGEIEVVLTGRARHVLASVVPGAPAEVRIQATGHAALEVGP